MKQLLLSVLLFMSCHLLNAQGWGQTQKIVPGDRYVGQRFGGDVAIDGNYAVVGVLVSNVAKDTYVFEKDSSGNWVEIQKLENPEPNQFDHFGVEVAIDGDYIFIGAIGEDYDTSGANYIQGAGAVYIFKKQASGLFLYEQKIVASDREYINEFGRCVAVSGDYAIVGVTRQDFDENGANFMDDAGAAYIFEKDVNGTWNEVQKIVSSDRETFDYFAADGISIDGNYAIVGAKYEDDDASEMNPLGSAGSAYVFERDGTGTWNEVQKIVASDREFGEWFGASVDVSGNTIIVGASQEYLVGNINAQYGATYIFEQDGSGIWNEVQKITPSDGENSSKFGHSISIDGNYLIVGAYLRSFTEAGTIYPGGGRAYVFEKDVTDTWTQAQNISASDRASSDYFGYSVAISGDSAIVGAYQEDEDELGLNFMQEAGSTYIFDANEPGTLSFSESVFNTNFKAYPNPTKSILNLDLGNYFDKVEVNVHNVLGQKVFSKNYRNVKAIQLELNQPKGVYLVDVKIGEQIPSVLKIIKY